jgi:hypothetical protein
MEAVAMARTARKGGHAREGTIISAQPMTAAAGTLN